MVFVEMFDNRTCNRTQGGRSMLEMLAVLGIVGLLGLTALFGYRYAMATAKSQRAFKDVMLRSSAIASSASFEQIKVGEAIKPLGYDEESGGMTYAQTKLTDDDYSITVSAFNDIACQKLIDMDYKETPVKAIQLNAGEEVAIENLRNLEVALNCQDNGNEVTYYFDRTASLIGRGRGRGSGNNNDDVKCSCSGNQNVAICQVGHFDTCGCLSSTSNSPNGSACGHGYDGVCWNGSCVCPPGTYGDGKNCTLCPAGTYRDTAGATKASDCKPCPSGAQSSDDRKICVCPAGSVWDKDNNRCAATCTSAGWDNAECKAKDGRYPDCYIEGGASVGYCMCHGFHNGKTCVRCNEAAGAKVREPWYSKVLTLCDCKNPEKTWYSQTNVCRCPPDTYFDGAHCRECAPGSHRPHDKAEDTCICDDPNYVWNPQTNTCDDKRTPCKKAGRDSEDCKSTDGKYPDCYIEPGKDTGYCMCEGFQDDKKICRRCNGNACATVRIPWYRNDLTLCMCTDQNAVWQAKNNSCVCKENYYRTSKVCSDNYCAPCGDGSYRSIDDDQDKCICPAGKIWNPNTNKCDDDKTPCKKAGRDSEDCKVENGTYPDCYIEPGKDTGYCMCEGFHDDTKQCIRCNDSAGATVRVPWYSDKLTLCMCKDSTKTWKPQTNSCDIDACEENFYRDDNGQCVPCGPGSHRAVTDDEMYCICDDPSLIWDREINVCRGQSCTPETEKEDCIDPAYPTCFTKPDGENICACLGWHDDRADRCIACDEKSKGPVPATPWEQWIYKPDMSGCVCPEHAQFVNGACVCDTGYAWDETTLSCVCGGVAGTGCNAKIIDDIVKTCDAASVSGKIGDGTITVTYCSVGTTPGEDGKGCIVGTKKTMTMHRQKQNKKGIFYAGGTPTNWYDTQIICQIMNKALKGTSLAGKNVHVPTNENIRIREKCRHPRRIRTALRRANGSLKGPGVPRRIWENGTLSQDTDNKCVAITHDVRAGKIQNDYRLLDLGTLETAFADGQRVNKAGGRTIWVDGGAIYPVCYVDVTNLHCDEDDAADDPSNPYDNDETRD